MAGPARRFSELAYELAVVCAADEPEPVIARFETLAAVVAVIERDERRAVGVTVDGVPVTLVVARPASFGTELVRATGSREYVEALEPLPDAPDEPALFELLGVPYCPPELRERPHAEPPRRSRGAERDPRRPALPHDVVGRKGDGGADGPRGPCARVRVPRDLRPQPERRGRARSRLGRAATPGGGDRRGERARRAVPAFSAASSATSGRTGHSTWTTTSWPSSTGCS